MRNKVLIPLICLLMMSVPTFSQTQDPKTPPKEPAKEQPKSTGIAGAWIMTVVMDQGEMPPADLTITQEKEAIKVSFTGLDGNQIPGEGTFKEGVVQWTASISTSNGDMKLLFKGKLEGEKITGNIQSDFGTINFSATKKK